MIKDFLQMATVQRQDTLQSVYNSSKLPSTSFAYTTLEDTKKVTGIFWTNLTYEVHQEERT